MRTLKFLIFLAYITAVFFLPNSWLVAVVVGINLIWLGIVGWRQGFGAVRKILRQTLRILPFVIFTMVFNWWLDSWLAALWIGAKLIIVCNATLIYAVGRTVREVAEVIAKLCAPLAMIGVRSDEVKILVAVALMMIPVLRQELSEMRQAGRAKGMAWNLATFRIMLGRLGWSLLARVNQIEEGLMAKGYWVE